MNQISEYNVSVIVPSYKFKNSFTKVFNSILNQDLKPKEIIIIDSTENNDIKKIIDLNINNENKIKIIYWKNNKRLNPGEARNLGVQKSNCEIISFLDSKTIPKKDWLKKSLDILINKKLDVVFGKTLYLSTGDKKKEFIKDLVYGNIHHVTTPGSLLYRNVFEKNKFVEGVRTVDDMFWRHYFIKNNFLYGLPDENNLTYEDITSSIFSMQKRFYLYSLNLININIQNTIKDFYLSILCIFLFLFVPRVNYISNYFSLDFLYLPHITKISFMMFFLLTLLLFFFKNFYRILFKYNLTYYTSLLTTFCIITLFIYNWNYYLTDLILKTALYIPHITKIYFLSLIILHFLLRAFYLPISRKVKILPFRWIRLGFYGMTLDFYKSPGYLMGALINLKFLIIKKK